MIPTLPGFLAAHGLSGEYLRACADDIEAEFGEAAAPLVAALRDMAREARPLCGACGGPMAHPPAEHIQNGMSPAAWCCPYCGEY